MQQELINLNMRKKTFEIEAEVQGQAVKGSFTVHFPSILEKIDIEAKLADLLRGTDIGNVQLDAYQAARASCYLDTVLDDKPDWFDYRYLDNFDVVMDVYEKAKEFEVSFRQGTKQLGSKEDSIGSTDEAVVEGE